MVVNLGFAKVNYTGPYISDGKFQTSVEFGKTPPLDRLDAFSRLHDSAFAHFDDYGHRTAANSIYHDQTKNGNSVENFAGNIVLYGNQAKTSFENLSRGVNSLPLLLYGGVKNMYNLADYATNEKKYKQEVLDYFETDPFKNDVKYNPYLNSDKGSSISELGIGGKRLQNKVAGETTTNETFNPTTNDEYGGGRRNNYGPDNYSNSYRLSVRFRRRRKRVYRI